MRLTSAQKQIYNTELVLGGSVNTVCGTVLLDKMYDTDDMKRAINEVYRINDALRTRILLNNGEPSQIVTEYVEREIETLYFNTKEEVHFYANQMAHASLDFYGDLCELKVILSKDFCGVFYRLHHIISDGWTLNLIASQFYKILTGKQVEAFSYSDYISEEENYLQSKRAVKDKEYFVEQFNSIDDVTFFTDTPSVKNISTRKTLIVDKEKTAKILNYTKQEDVSAYTLFLTLISTYFSKVKNNVEKFYIGTTVLNRTGHTQRNTAGMFVNTVPYFAEIETNSPFSVNLKKTQDNLFGLFRHQKYNYTSMLSEVSRTSIFDIMFSYENSTIYGEDCESTWYHCGMQNENLHIHIDDRDNEGIFRIHYDYHTQKFAEHDIDILHQRLMMFLSDAIDNADKPLYDLNCLTDDEKQKLLNEFNDTVTDYPRDKCVHTFFDKITEKEPDAVAVVASDKTLTYAELNEEANKIANALTEKGVNAGDVVAFVLPRRSCVLSTMLGILKSGAAYLPIDPDYPKDRIEYILTDSKAKFCVTEDNIQELLNSTNATNPNVNINSDSVCYCIYTSGSTGKPKGTLITHKNVVNYSSDNNFNVKSGIITDDCNKIVSVTTTGFDIFVTESLLPLINGMEIILADEEESRIQSKLSKLILSTKADVIQTTPTKMKAFISDKKNADYLKELKVIILGGEALDNSLVTDLKKLTDAKIFNIYGPTETTVWSSFAEVTDGEDITIGKPIANTQIYIVDKYMNLMPIGVTGEICIAGDGVGSGYLNQPDLTAEKFIDNPFGSGKLYKTGDLAYWRDDGNICYVGRNDFQVKIRGQRIELGEIENALSSVDGVVQCAAIVRKDDEDRQFICAFYTGIEIDSKELRTVLSSRLPKYMVPHIFTHLPEMPLTSSGKISRNNLPQVDLNNISTDTEYVAPQTKEEAILTEAIECVLDCDKVSTLDNFFDLGGDSLKSIELTSELEDKGYTVNVKSIFEALNIQELAKQLTVKTTEEETITYDSVLPATAAQMRVYTSQFMSLNSAHYNIPSAFKVDELNVEKLQNAIDKLVSRHESLRTHFENRNGQIVQVIDDTATLEVQALSSDDISLFNTPFDLSKSPLLKVGYYENTVMIVIHHIIADGESMSVFYDELNELYMGRELNKTVQYGEFAVTDTYTEENETYWLNIFNDEINTLELKTDYDRPEKQSFAGSQIYELINIDIHNKITEKCKELNVTPYVFYMACYNILLSKYSGNEDICVGVPISGRTSKFLDTIGMFVNTVALRNNTDGNKTINTLIQEIKEHSISAIDNQNYPFGELVKKLNISSVGRNPIFDVMFAYQGEQITNIIFGDKKAEALPVSLAGVKCDFNFNIMTRTEDVVLMVEYCTDLFKEETLSKFISSYKNILTQCLDETKLIKDIDAISKEEKQKVLLDFNNTPYTYEIPENSTLYSLFEKMSEENKEKVCIKANDSDLTFADFKAYAERIDSKIREITVNEKSVIAVICERSFEMYGAVYGIIRGGNAYLPIDPNYPQDRIDYILENSNAKAVIAQDKFCHLAGNTPCIDATKLLNSTEEVIKTECLATPDDTAYVIYTSGSTGNPKGAKISHKSAINRILWMHDFYPLEENDVILQKTPYTFDVSVWELFWWGITGRTLCASKPDEHFLPAKILYETEKNKVTHLHFVPSVFDIFLTYLENNPQEQNKFNSVKYVFLSGEALTANHIKRFYNIYDYNKVQLHNLYGPTECAVDVSYYACVPTDTDPVPIGKPIYNTQLYIVDKHLNPTPTGVVGELCIAGTNVGQGYLNNPDLTAEKFIDNPFGSGKLYKTGDLAYWRDDGNICYVGRMDGQIKLNGQRVEFGEIEKVIGEVSGVESVAVIIRQNNEQDMLVAFCCGDESSTDEIIKHCENKLPQYMIPSKIQFIEKMPLNASGKLDRKALKNIDVVFDDAVVKEPPANETEKMLCELFEKTLHIDSVGRNESFFTLGGTSLDMISILSENELKDISAAEFIANPTPEKLAVFLEQNKSAEKSGFYALREIENSTKALILVPYAGGDASAFTVLTQDLTNLAPDLSLYYVDYLRSYDECANVAEKIKTLSKTKEIIIYSHCAGTAVALQLINILESNGVELSHYITGGFIPPKKASKRNSWNYIPDKLIQKTLIKAGAPIEKFSAEHNYNMVDKFRKDADFMTEYFYKNAEKINAPTSVVISKNDLFTRNYKDAENLWKKHATNFDKVHFINTDSHYFQTDNSEILAELIIKSITNE